MRTLKKFNEEFAALMKDCNFGYTPVQETQPINTPSYYEEFSVYDKSLYTISTTSVN